ncbi:MAG: hypothetical protein K6C94_02515 [Candidatus Gastranaerophilales bacterium]|nr:hypothetical protein [Candidatus Gastranaerophilales bacterium]
MIDIQDISVFDKVRENLPVQEVSVNFNSDSLLTYTKTIKIAAVKKPEIVPPQTDYISPDIKNYINILNNGNLDEQKKCLGIILNRLRTYNAEKNAQFLDAGLTDALFNVVNQDVSKLKKPTFTQKRLRKKIEEGKKLSYKEWEKANTLTDYDEAILNKMDAFKIIAELQIMLYLEIVNRSDLKPTFYEMPATARLLEAYENEKSEDMKAYIVTIISRLSLVTDDFDRDICDFLQKAAKSKSKTVKQTAEKALELKEK